MVDVPELNSFMSLQSNIKFAVKDLFTQGWQGYGIRRNNISSNEFILNFEN